MDTNLTLNKSMGFTFHRYRKDNGLYSLQTLHYTTMSNWAQRKW